MSPRGAWARADSQRFGWPHGPSRVGSSNTARRRCGEAISRATRSAERGGHLFRCLRVFARRDGSVVAMDGQQTSP